MDLDITKDWLSILTESEEDDNDLEFTNTEIASYRILITSYCPSLLQQKYLFIRKYFDLVIEKRSVAFTDANGIFYFICR